MRSNQTLLAAAWLYLLSPHAYAEIDSDSLAGQALEALLDTEVSSVLKHASGLSEAPAAVTVIGREDIERSGATTLPDLLRIVPGLAVAQIDGNKWAVGARGLNGFFDSKLLVLIDGRSIYNRTFSGVFWDAYDIPFDNIARIEVIRGPAGVLWGSNAVNGVINIVTRSAQETTGGRVELTAGNVEKHLVDLRYGASNENASWRVYARSRDRDEQKLPNGASPNDFARADRVGFRADSAPGGATGWMLSGETYQGQSGGVANPLPTDDDINGYNLLGRVTRKISPASNLQLQFYIDHSWRRETAVGSVIREDVFDIDLIHDTILSPAHRLTWGGGWRQYRFDSTGSAKLSFMPDNAVDAVGNVFVQDEWSLIPRELLIVAGVRAENLPKYGVQWQPNLRVAWTPNQQHLFWAATSKAVRAPNMYDTSLRFTGPLGGYGTVRAWGNPDFMPENVVSLEAGWRAKLSRHLASDVSIYRNRYRKLEILEPVLDSLPRITYRNDAEGIAQGLEWALDWQAADNWQLRGGLTLYKEDLRADEGVPPKSAVAFQGGFPNRQAFLRSLWDISHDQRFDITLRGVGPMPKRGVSGYGTMDFRWTWRQNKNLAFSLTGRNLTGPEHYEISDQPYFLETKVRRELFATVTLNFR